MTPIEKVGILLTALSFLMMAGALLAFFVVGVVIEKIAKNRKRRRLGLH